jgi:transketolase
VWAYPIEGMAALLAGDIDGMPRGIAPQSLKQFQADKRFVVEVGSTSGKGIVAINNRKRPTVLFLSRQAMANQANSTAAAVAKGGYVLEDSTGTPELILIGSGTELELCTKAAAELRAAGKNVRVVSMPCVELFEEQDAAYRESVLPAAVRKRLVVEASSSYGWHKYSGFDGDTVSIDRYGASAPGPLLMEKFGFTVENVVAKANALLA